MKKRLISLLLVFALLAALPCGAAAASHNYGSVPIYIGYCDVDYLAEELLREIPTEGKSDVEKIRAVYDWIIRNCQRYDWDGTYYFDEQDVVEQVSDWFYDQAEAAAGRGEVLIRTQYEDELVYDSNYGMYVMSYDANQYIATFAYDMMLYRTGNCAHYSALLALLLGHLGYDCRLIAGNFINKSGSQVEHKWNCVLLNGKYYWLDVRMDHANYESNGKLSYKYFMVEDTAEWAKRHSWDDSYSSWLESNAATIAEEYAYTSVSRSGKPWARCSSWAEGVLERADGMGLIPEVLENRDMTADITRAEFAAVAVALYGRLKGSAAPAFTGANPFTDTSDADVLRAYGLGVVNGVGEGKFDPTGKLTREQAVTMLGRVYELATTGTVGDGSTLAQKDGAAFSDDAAISAYARNYIGFFVGAGVINGMGDGRFAPKASMTREAALKTAAEAAGLS